MASKRVISADSLEEDFALDDSYNSDVEQAAEPVVEARPTKKVKRGIQDQVVAGEQQAQGGKVDKVVKSPKAKKDKAAAVVEVVAAVPVNVIPAVKAKIVSGDSLEEDFVLEDDFAPFDANSDDDISPSADISTALYDSENESAPAAARPAKKAKVAGVPGEKKEKKEKKVKGGVEVEVVSIGLSPIDVLPGQFADKQKRALPKLSSIEMDDLRITESMFFDTSSVTDRSSLAAFIRAAIPVLPSTLAKPPKKTGSPRVIVIAGAALRVADICRDVKEFKSKETEVAKLFAKHFKLAEHVEYLNKTKVGIAVGTPGRIGKLFSESDSLSLTHLSHLVLDVSHLDSKKRSLLDMPEAREDLFKFVLGHKALMERLREQRMKLVLF